MLGLPIQHPSLNVLDSHNNFRRFSRNHGQVRDVGNEAVAPFARRGALFTFQNGLVLCLPLDIGR